MKIVIDNGKVTTWGNFTKPPRYKTSDGTRKNWFDREYRNMKKYGRHPTRFNFIRGSTESALATSEQHCMTTALAYIGAALAEIAGCFAFWGWLRLDKPIWWLAPGMLSLAAFAYLLTLVDVSVAGRAYAAYRRRLHCPLAGMAMDD